MGVPLFSKAEIKDSANIDLRVCQKSLDVILKYFKKRIVFIENFDDLVKILSQSMPSLNELTPELQNQISEQSNGQNGSLIFSIKSDSSDNQLSKMMERNQNISFTAWLGKTTLRPLLNVNARTFFLTMCGLDKDVIGKNV
jgi:hypothetical protein